MTSEEAKASIIALGLQLGEIAEAHHDDVSAGNVISQDPAAGASVKAGSNVALVVSQGTAGGEGEGEDPDKEKNKFTESS